MSCSRVDVLDVNHKETCAEIANGLMILLGVTHDDTEADARYIADKAANLRIFEDDAGKLNLSVKDVGGSILLVSQFTLYADARNGRRPSFSAAAPAEQAQTLYLHTAELLRGHGLNVQTAASKHICRSACATTAPLPCCWTRKNCFDENPTAEPKKYCPYLI